jgi:hypothetical protein
MEHRHQLMTRETLPSWSTQSATHYRSLAGALLYASVATRPAITEPVNRLCRFMTKPKAARMEDAKNA